MYRIYAGLDTTSDGKLHDPYLACEGRVVIEPILTEKLNTHGILTFSVAPTNPMYNELYVRKTKVRVVSSTSANNKPWFGRIISIERGFDNIKHVTCEGELAFLCDSIKRPFGFSGSPAQLLQLLIDNYNGSHTDGPTFVVGNVSVTDPNNTIVRSSADAHNVWEMLDEKLFGSSLGGYIIPRYDRATGTHYIDYLSLDETDAYIHVTSQIVKYGSNLLNFTQTESAEDIVTVLIPYGAEISDNDPPASGQWDGNRLTIESANENRDYIENSDGVNSYGRIVGTKIWDDVTIASNLLTKATAWLDQQIYSRISIELSAIDLSSVDADIDQIQVGNYVPTESVPHDLKARLLCTEKTTYLTHLEDSAIILGAGLLTITDLQKKGVDLD